MGGGRINLILSTMGVVLVGLLVFYAVIQMARRRLGVQGQETDPMGFEAGEPSGPARNLPPMVFDSFGSVLRQVVLPRAEANPGWERLDGAHGVRGDTIARFDRNGTLYALNGDSEMAALRAALDWIERHPDEDPLEILPTKKGAGRLALRPEIAGNPGSVRIETA